MRLRGREAEAGRRAEAGGRRRGGCGQALFEWDVCVCVREREGEGGGEREREREEGARGIQALFEWDVAPDAAGRRQVLYMQQGPRVRGL